jgi:hypothetical protein
LSIASELRTLKRLLVSVKFGTAPEMYRIKEADLFAAVITAEERVRA